MECLLCDKTYDYFEDLLHHMELEHRPISSKTLDIATKARETLKQIGNPLENSSKLSANVCPDCFEIFPTVELIDQHRKKDHDVCLTSDAKKKLIALNKQVEKSPPKCEICNLQYQGLIVCRMKGKTVQSCFNCYEEYYDKNALQRLTLGQPDEMIKQMRTPVGI